MKRQEKGHREKPFMMVIESFLPFSSLNVIFAVSSSSLEDSFTFFAWSLKKMHVLFRRNNNKNLIVWPSPCLITWLLYRLESVLSHLHPLHPSPAGRDGEPEKYWEAWESQKKYGERRKKWQGRKSRVIKLSCRRNISHKWSIFQRKRLYKQKQRLFQEEYRSLDTKIRKKTQRGHFKSYTLKKYAFPWISRDKKQTVKRSGDSPSIIESRKEKIDTGLFFVITLLSLFLSLNLFCLSHDTQIKSPMLFLTSLSFPQ